MYPTSQFVSVSTLKDLGQLGSDCLREVFLGHRVTSVLELLALGSFVFNPRHRYLRVLQFYVHDKWSALGVV